MRSKDLRDQQRALREQKVNAPHCNLINFDLIFDAHYKTVFKFRAKRKKKRPLGGAKLSPCCA